MGGGARWFSIRILTMQPKGSEFESDPNHCIVVMCSIPVLRKYSGIKSDGIIFCGLAKYRSLLPGGIAFK